MYMPLTDNAKETLNPWCMSEVEEALAMSILKGIVRHFHGFQGEAFPQRLGSITFPLGFIPYFMIF